MICPECHKECVKFTAGICSPCYQRKYRAQRLFSAKDLQKSYRIEARKSFNSLLKESVLSIISRTELSSTPADWAEKNIRLPAATSFGGNGRINWEVSPDSVEILDQLRNPLVHKIILAFSAQSGKSLLLQAGTAYLAQVRGDSIVYGLPSDALLKSVPVGRITPMLDLSGFKYKRIHEKIVFEGRNSLDFVLLTSRKQLAEKTARVIVADEITELPDLAFDPIAELQERQRIYPDDLFLLASTPKNPDRDILAHYNTSRRHVIEWKCPQCEAWFECHLDDIKSKNPEVTEAETIIDQNLGFTCCPHCGTVVDDSDHLTLVKGQRWKCLTPERGVRSMGYRKWIIQTPFKNFSHVLAKKIESEGNPMLWAQFLANWCAAPIDASVSAHDVAQTITRGQYFRGEPPADSIGWIMGADIGGTEAWVSCLAFSPRGIHQFWSQRIDRDRNDEDGVLRGFLHLINDRSWGIPYMGCAIDCGYEQEIILRMIAKIPLAIGVKGDGGGMSQPFKASSDGRMQILNHYYWQDYFQASLNNGSIQIPANAFEWIEKHFKGEVKRTVLDHTTKIPKSIWVLRGQHTPNHLRDASIYALFLGQQKGLCNIKRQSENQQIQIPKQVNQGFRRVPIKGIGQRDRW